MSVASNEILPFFNFVEKKFHLFFQGLPMPSRTLARRMAALITCKVLHQSGELDDSLQPIGKEGFRASEPDWDNFDLEKADEEIVNENSEPRPGTTRRRQYYYKKV